MYSIPCFGGITSIAVSMEFHQRRHSDLKSKAAVAEAAFQVEAFPAAVLAEVSLAAALAAVPAEVGNMK